MKNATRELLLITNAARAWGEEHFSEQVAALMAIAGKVDTPAHLEQSTEVLDVYHHNLTTADIKSTSDNAQKPFAFIAFRN